MKHVGFRFGWRTTLIVKRGTRPCISPDRHCKKSQPKTKARARLVEEKEKVPIMSQQVSPGVIVTDSDFELGASSFDSGGTPAHGGPKVQVQFVGAGDPLQPHPSANTLKLPQSARTGSTVTTVAVGCNVNIDPNGGTLNGSAWVPKGKALTLYFTTNQTDPCGAGTWTPECCELPVLA